jgi:hypothetical protein
MSIVINYFIHPSMALQPYVGGPGLFFRFVIISTQ